MSKNVFYRPNLGIDRKYNTDGLIAYKDFKELVSILENNDIYVPPKLQTVIENIVDVKNTIPYLPNNIQDTMKIITDLIQFIIIQINPDDIPEDSNSTEEPITKDDADLIISTPDNIEDVEKDNNYNLLISEDVPTADITKVNKDPVALLNKYYSGTYLEIVDDYLNKVKEATTNYYLNMTQIIKDSQGNDFNYIEKIYTYKTTDLKDSNLQHISDYIIKSQIVRDQKNRMFNKLYTEQEALNKLKACETAKELYIRYLREQKKQQRNFLDVYSNMNLEQSKLIYENKIDENLYELYKYFSSSVIVLNECLQLYVNEAQSKLIIIKEEGIKL